jgi:hypothetical protein
MAQVSWMDPNLKRGMRAYLLRQRTRITWRKIADRIGYSSLEGARSAAKRYSKKRKLPWPVPNLTRGFLYYQQYLDGESWEEIAYDWQQPGIGGRNRVQNCARVWARRHNMPWPPERNTTCSDNP